MGLKRIAKRQAIRVLRSFGLEVYHKARLTRVSMCGVLEHIRSLGVRPSIVIDVGAADGTTELYDVFPESQHILIEPLCEFEPRLKQLKSEREGLSYVIAAAASERGETVLNVHYNLYGSSRYTESDGPKADGIPRIVPTVVLDDLCYQPGNTYLVKIDVQGGELDVLAGASQILKASEIVILEVSLYQFFNNGPQFYDVIHYMHERGHAVYDIFNVCYRPLDGAVSQVDVAFAPVAGILRRYHGWATPEQRGAYDRMFSKRLEQLGISRDVTLGTGSLRNGESLNQPESGG